jgi:hypothetical protein
MLSEGMTFALKNKAINRSFRRKYKLKYCTDHYLSMDEFGPISPGLAALSRDKNNCTRRLHDLRLGPNNFNLKHSIWDNF